MPFQTTSEMKPKKNSLVVCAGTVSIRQVDSMSAGFSLFQTLFKGNKSCNKKVKGGWKAELQQKLDDFFDSKKPMPVYVCIAKQGTLLGGVATVPIRDSYTGLNHETLGENRDEVQRALYKSAVKEAVLDAKQRKRPLFLQPLGIGVYSWQPEEAAILFAEAIREADPTDEVDITIPIYLASPTSSDQLFKQALTAEMAKKRHPSQPSAESNKLILSTIIATLISNIENKSGARWTSGVNSKKVTKLKAIQQSINQQADFSVESDEFKQQLNAIMAVCKIKRHSLHFWSAPHSVNEYIDLLKKNNIEFNADNISHKNKK